MEHARRIRADILTEKEDRVGPIEILDPRRADRHAKRCLQPDRRRFMAHVRAVGQILVPVHPRHEAIHIGGFETGPARGIKGDRGGIERAQRGTDRVEGLVPAAGYIFVGCRIIAKRVREPPLLLEIVIRPAAQLRQAVLLEKVRRRAASRQFPGGGLRAFFAEFGGMMIGGLGPGAAHAHEALRLVLAQQLPVPARVDPLAGEDIGERADRSPATRGPAEAVYMRPVAALSHRQTVTRDGS